MALCAGRRTGPWNHGKSAESERSDLPKEVVGATRLSSRTCNGRSKRCGQRKTHFPPYELKKPSLTQADIRWQRKRRLSIKPCPALGLKRRKRMALLKRSQYL